MTKLLSCSLILLFQHKTEFQDYRAFNIRDNPEIYIVC